VQEIAKKYESQNEGSKDDRDYIYKNLSVDILDKLQRPDLNLMKAYHKNISLATGMNVGVMIANDSDKIFKMFEDLFQSLSSSSLFSNSLLQRKNEIREYILNVLKVNKIDNVIILQ